MKFNEADLRVRLATLEPAPRIGFALSAACRLLRNFESYRTLAGLEPDQRPEQCAADLWEHIIGRIQMSDTSDLDSRTPTLLSLMPGDEQPWNELHSIAEDAIAALVYSYRCLASNDPQEGAWAARHAYEAADQVAQQRVRTDPSDPSYETALLSHSVVQQELTRQNRDLSLAISGSLREMRQHSASEDLFD